MRHRLLLGIAVTLAGVLLMLGNLGVLDLGQVWRFWPVAMVAAGVVLILRRLLHPVPGMVLVVIGGLFLLRSLGLADVRLRHVWPVLIIGLGAAIVWDALRRDPARSSPRNEDSSDVLKASCFLGAIQRAVTSAGFKGGEVTAFLSGCEIDLRRAGLSPDGAVLEIESVLSGVEILVPDGWDVRLEVVPILGALSDETRRPQSAGGPRLSVRGRAILSGVEIKS